MQLGCCQHQAIMLIITGPGRSGTSLLALFCERMGFDPHGEWHEGVDAGMEDPRVVRINLDIIKEYAQTGKYDKALARHGETIRSFEQEIIKDPRFSLFPFTLKAWFAIRNDLTILLTYRNPEESIASRRRLNRALKFRGMSPDMVRKGFADTLELLLRERVPFELLLFPYFLDQFDEVFTAFQNLGLKMDKDHASQVWSAVIDKSKIHITEDTVHENVSERLIKFIARVKRRLRRRRAA